MFVYLGKKEIREVRRLDEGMEKGSERCNCCKVRTTQANKLVKKEKSLKQGLLQALEWCSFLTWPGTSFNKALSVCGSTQGYTVHHSQRIEIQYEQKESGRSSSSRSVHRAEWSSTVQLLSVSGESLSALIQSASSIAAGTTQETHAHIHLKAHKDFVYSSSTANRRV